MGQKYTNKNKKCHLGLDLQEKKTCLDEPFIIRPISHIDHIFCGNFNQDCFIKWVKYLTQRTIKGAMSM